MRARSSGRCARPLRTSRVPCRTACRMARHHNAQASPGFGIVVGHGADLLGRENQGVRVVEIGQGDRRGPHQRSVAAGAAGAGMVLASKPTSGRHRSARSRHVSERRGWQRTARSWSGCRHPWPSRPSLPSGPRSGHAPRRSQVRAGRGDLGDGDGHRGVVGPLPRRPAQRPAALHRHRNVRTQRRAELVRGAQRVTTGHAEQDARGAVDLRGAESSCHATSIRWWRRLNTVACNS